MKIDQYGVLSFVGHCTDTFYQMLLFIQLDLETLECSINYCLKNVYNSLYKPALKSEIYSCI